MSEPVAVPPAPDIAWSDVEKLAERTRVTDALAAAAIRLRDAELERQAAGKAYAEALDAFNRVVAPVGP